MLALPIVVSLAEITKAQVAIGRTVAAICTPGSNPRSEEVACISPKAAVASETCHMCGSWHGAPALVLSFSWIPWGRHASGQACFSKLIMLKAVAVVKGAPRALSEAKQAAPANLQQSMLPWNAAGAFTLSF